MNDNAPPPEAAEYDWLRPWKNVARFLNQVLAHTAAATILLAILYAGQQLADRYLHASDTIWLKGTPHEFSAFDLFHASDLAIILLFIASGMYHGFEELRK